MHSLKLPISNLNYPVVEYAAGRNLTITLGTNNIRALDYALAHSWVLDNQNPLVTFLKILSLDINQSDEYLYNIIANKRYTAAGLCKITSIYNKGKSFNKVLFPEPNHETLLVVPFGKGIYDSNYYFTTDPENLKPLTTIYTTDNRIRYSTTRMTDNVNNSKLNFTAVQVDPFALAIGYIRYCRERISTENPAMLTPNFYLSTLPLASFYIQHNNYVLLNVLENKNFEIDDTKWNQVNITQTLSSYLDFQNSTLNNIAFKSINHYIKQLNALPLEFRTNSNLFPANGFSSSFIQLSWPYSYGPMQLSIMYLKRMKTNNIIDDAYKSYLRRFLNYNLNTITNSIPSNIWINKYNELYNELKNLL